MRYSNDIFCLIGKRGAGKDALADNLELPKITISKILTQYCHDNNLIPDRNTMTELGNTIFDGETLANSLIQQLPNGGIITGLRKPETLHHLMQKQRCLLIGVLADDFLRRQRVTHRNRLGDTMPYRHFLEHERQENSPPNKQSIDLLNAFCDIHIENNSSLEDCIEKGKQALQKVLSKPHTPTHIDIAGYQHFTRAILINEHDEILLLYDKNKQLYTLPGGKVDTGETPDYTIYRELQEEIGVTINQLDYCGSFPGLFKDGLSKGHFFEGVIDKKSISIQEPTIHTQYRRIPKNELSLQLGFTTFLDTGLYHYIHHRRISNRQLTWKYNMDTSFGNDFIQYIDPRTNIIHITPRHHTLDPCYIPLRIMNHKNIHQGLWAQKMRTGAH